MKDENSINVLFNETLNRMGGKIPDGTKEVFEKLIRETLKYRDAQVARNEPPITVGEVENALTIFQKTLETGAFPDDIPAQLLPLLENWIAALTAKP